MSTKEPPARVRHTDAPTPLPDGIELGPWRRVSIGIMREARIPRYADREWKALWHTKKLDFLLRGFAVKESNGEWFLQQWLQGSPGNWTLNEVGMNRLQAITSYRPPAMVQALMPLPADMILPELPGGLEEKLFEYQRTPARQIFRALTQGKDEWGYPGAWDCSDMGTGKTYQSLAAALATGLEVGVICPKSVIGNARTGSGWHGAFAHFEQKPAFVLNYDSLRTGRSEWIKKTGVEGRPFEWTLDPDDVALIFDEAHLVKNVSLNRRLAQAALRQGFRIIFISGTMAAQPTNLGATGVAVGLHNGTKESYAEFLRTHGCRKIGQEWKFNRAAGARHLVRIHGTVFPRRGARVRIDELGDRFPETQIMAQAVATDDTVAIAKAYEEAQALLAKLKAQGYSEEALSAAERIAYMKARRMSEIAKIPAIVEMAEAEIAEGRSVAIFTNFTEARERAMKELKTDCSVDGSQNTEQRNEALRRFQADEVRCIVLMSKAGGTGVSLHDVRGEFPRTAIICPDNDAVVLGQTLGRVHRAGGKSRSRQFIVYAEDTIEEGICNNVRAKLLSIASLNDGDLTPDKKF